MVLRTLLDIWILYIVSFWWSLQISNIATTYLIAEGYCEQVGETLPVKSKMRRIEVRLIMCTLFVVCCTPEYTQELKGCKGTCSKVWNELFIFKLSFGNVSQLSN
jgi:di/tricarboxylate transporter